MKTSEVFKKLKDELELLHWKYENLCIDDIYQGLKEDKVEDYIYLNLYCDASDDYFDRDSWIKDVNTELKKLFEKFNLKLTYPERIEWQGDSCYELELKNTKIN